jgi:spore coat polysaccharide biosynthesis protein SpsF
MKTVIIVQARMGSTRLPGKVLREVGGKPLLAYELERLCRVRLADEIVVATTTGDADTAVVELCGRLGVACTRGPEDDVLARYHAAAVAHGADVVVRITADCPVIDPAIVDEAIAAYRNAGGELDYVSNGLEDSFPRGMDVEVLSMRALDEAFNEAQAQDEREHVTPFIYRHPERYRLANLRCAEMLAHHRWTVDTPEDFELVSRIIGTLYPANPAFGMADILALLARHPGWSEINAHVMQKTVTTN